MKSNEGRAQIQDTPAATNCRAFTLIELLMVVAVLTLLMSLLLPTLRGVRASARQTVCLSNLHQAGMLTELIADDQNGLLPFWVSNAPPLPTLGRSDQRTVYGPHLSRWDVFVCPADSSARDVNWRDGGYTSYDYYAGFWMNRYAEEGVPDPIRAVTMWFRREPSATLLFDSRRRHPMNTRNGVYLPDLHAQKMGR